jgi:putative salt-induced outer membrane protein
MRRSVLSLLLLLVSTSMAFADQVTLKNGDRISGKIQSSDTKALLIKSDFAGDVTIQWDAITGIESSDNLILTLKDGSRLTGKITTQDGKFVVAGAANPAPAAKDNVVAVRDEIEQKNYDVEADKIAHPKLFYFWSGLIDTGLALTRGNSQTASFTLAGKVERDTARNKFTAASTYVFASDDSTPPSRTTANQLDAGFRDDYNLTPRMFVFGLVDFQTNELQNLSLRTNFGGGFGYHVIKTDNTVFDIFGGISYDRDSFSAYTLPGPPPVAIPSLIQNSAEALVGEEFDQKFGKRSTLTERFTFFPNLSHGGDYRFQFDTTVATQLKAWLSWQATFSDRYISYPPPGIKGNDLLLSTGLRVTWGKVKL